VGNKIIYTGFLIVGMLLACTSTQRNTNNMKWNNWLDQVQNDSIEFVSLRSPETQFALLNRKIKVSILFLKILLPGKNPYLKMLMHNGLFGFQKTKIN